MHQVSIVPCNSYENKEVEKALETTFKNLEFSFKKNLKILIKPNILSPEPKEKAITTHPVILEELCKILQKYNADIYIAESSGRDTDTGFIVSGIGELRKYAKIVNFEKIPKSFHDFPTLKRVPLPNIINEVDLIINVAKLKTHAFTGVTLCVKNLYGCIPGSIKSHYHSLLPSPQKFSKFLLELHEKIKPQLNIIDGVIGLEGLGPGAPGTPIESKVIISGRNAIATDIIASHLMGFPPCSIHANRLSGIQKESIEVIGEKIKIHFKKPLSFGTFVSPIMQALNQIFPKPKIQFYYSKCSKCHLCGKKCPVFAIAHSTFPNCNHDKCIRCLCCIEICPNAAVYLKENITRKIAKKFCEALKQIL